MFVTYTVTSTENGQIVVETATIGWLQIKELGKNRTERVLCESMGYAEFTTEGTVCFIIICKLYAVLPLQQ